MKKTLGMWILPIFLTPIASNPLFAADPNSLPAIQEVTEAERPRYVTSVTLESWLDEGREVTLFDVRKPEEFAAGHLPNARNVMYDQVASLVDELARDRLIVLYCIHSTFRAPTAAKTLKTLGFNQVYVLEGGVVAWKASGFAIRANDLAQAPKILPQPDCICSRVERP